MENSLLISVLLPVYNGGVHLNESIQSILNQTYKNFELIIIDDGSTDDSLSIMRSYNDNRIKILVNEFNIGHANTLNLAIKAANGEYIARQDQDDISFPDRLKKQLQFFNENLSTKVLSSGISIFSDIPSTNQQIHFQLTEVKAEDFFFGNILFHPTVMVKKECFNDYMYSSSFPNAEDFDLWTRMVTRFHIDIIQESLVYYRIHPSSMTRSNHALQIQSTQKIIHHQLQLFLGTHIHLSWVEFFLDPSSRNTIESVRDFWLFIEHLNSKIKSHYARKRLLIMIFRILYHKRIFSWIPLRILIKDYKFLTAHFLTRISNHLMSPLTH